MVVWVRGVVRVLPLLLLPAIGGYVGAHAGGPWIAGLLGGVGGVLGATWWSAPNA